MRERLFPGKYIWACLLLVLLAPARLQAAGTGEGRSRPEIVGGKLRLQLPFINWCFFNGEDVTPTLLGGSAAIEFFRLLTVEVGANGFFVMEETRYEIFAHAGPIFDLVDRRRADGKGFRLQTSGLLGYGFYHDSIDGHEGYDGSEKHHCLSLGLSLEPAYYFLRHLGINARLLFRTLWSLSSEIEGNTKYMERISKSGPKMEYMLEIGASVGLSF